MTVSYEQELACAPESLQNLDIVLFRRYSIDRGEQYVLHRIVDRDAQGNFIIAGDNCMDSDIVSPGDILGVVVSAQRKSRPIRLDGLGYRLYETLWCKLYRFRFRVLRLRASLYAFARRLIKGRN